MIELFGELYYIDFAELDKFILLDKKPLDKTKLKTVVQTEDAQGKVVSTVTTIDEQIKHKEIDAVRFDIIRNFIADIGDEVYEEDPRLGELSLGKTSIKFKLAFNTLVAYRLLKKMD
jgi:hypothetical protein